MPQSKLINRRVVLASRPHGAPLEANFRIEQSPIPEPAEGQVLLRTVYLSLDPYMRGRMSDAPSYAAPVEIGGVIVGGTVCRVEASKTRPTRSVTGCCPLLAGRTTRCPMEAI